MKSRAATIVDLIFLNIIILVAIIVWLRQYMSFFNAFLSGIIVCVAFNGLMRIRQLKKKSKLLDKKDKKRLEECFFYFMLCDQNQLLCFMRSLFVEQEMNIDLSQLALPPNAYNKTQPNYFVEKDTLYIVDVNPKEIDITPMTKYLQSYYKNDCSKIVLVVPNGLSKDSKSLLNMCTKDYTVYDKQKLYLLMKEKNKFPNITIQKLKNKTGFLTIISTLFSPLNIRKYLVASAILFLYSYFLRSNLYYMIFGFMCLTFAVVCKIRQLTA